MVKKYLFCSGVLLVRKASTAAQASEICDGEFADMIVAARSADLVCESVAYE